MSGLHCATGKLFRYYECISVFRHYTCKVTNDGEILYESFLYGKFYSQFRVGIESSATKFYLRGGNANSVLIVDHRVSFDEWKEIAANLDILL